MRGCVQNQSEEMGVTQQLQQGHAVSQQSELANAANLSSEEQDVGH